MYCISAGPESGRPLQLKWLGPLSQDNRTAKDGSKSLDVVLDRDADAFVYSSVVIRAKPVAREA